MRLKNGMRARSNQISVKVVIKESIHIKTIIGGAFFDGIATSAINTSPLYLPSFSYVA
jgi:hypothetical protein